MSQYHYYLANLRSNRIVAHVQLSSFSGEVRLDAAGKMSAEMLWASMPLSTRLEMEEYTTPGKYSIVCERDGWIVGEWIIWGRSREDDYSPVQLTGAEIISFADARQVESQVTYNNVEQLTIAGDLLDLGMNGSTGLNIKIPEMPETTKKRDRTYYVAEASYGERLRELSQVIDGFDYYLTTEWAETSVDAIRTVSRVAHFAYPYTGVVRDFLFTKPRMRDVGGGATLPTVDTGNVSSLKMDEDATRLGSIAFAVGAGEGSDKIVGRASTKNLTNQGYPSTSVAGSWSSVIRQTTINSHARDLLKQSQEPRLPPTITVFPDRSPVFGSYNLGDQIYVRIQPSMNFPSGYDFPVRILGWTFNPPKEGPETLAISIFQEPSDIVMEG